MRNFASVMMCTLAVACDGGGVAEPRIGETEASIQGGQVETGYSAVGEIEVVFPTGTNVCTGILITPSWVLTAAHCVDQPGGSGGGCGGEGNPCPKATSAPMTFNTGNNPGQFVPNVVDQQFSEPGRDLLLAHLASPITTIAPMWINTGALPPVGSTCIGVGFGVHKESNGSTTDKIKRSCTETVESADASTIVMHAGSGIPDHEDSGGPLLCTGVVAAVVRDHTDNSNHVRENYTTIDPQWIFSITGTNYSSDILWRGNDGSVDIWQMSGSAIQSQITTGAPDNGWQIMGVGDFDGDHVSDLYWQCTAPSCYGTQHGQLAIWYQGQASSPGPSYPGLVADDGWHIVGFGDFDGDGRTDVLWQCTAAACYATQNGQLAIWFGGQATNPPPLYPGVIPTSGWRIQGVGDFDGDGRSDILIRWTGSDGNHGLIAAWWAGQYWSPVLGQVWDDQWVVSGIGDFDGNGTSDVLWRYYGPVNHGLLAVWWNGQYANPAPWYPGYAGNDSWIIAGIGDFDGNRKSDVLWRYLGGPDLPRGQLAIWFGAQDVSPPSQLFAVVADSLILQGTGLFK